MWKNYERNSIHMKMKMRECEYHRIKHRHRYVVHIYPNQTTSSQRLDHHSISYHSSNGVCNVMYSHSHRHWYISSHEHNSIWFIQFLNSFGIYMLCLSISSQFHHQIYKSLYTAASPHGIQLIRKIEFFPRIKTKYMLCILCVCLCIP